MRPVPKVTVALPTPFTGEQRLVDFDGLYRLVCWLKEQHIESLIPAGTTGEFAALGTAERREVLVATREALGPEGFCFANISACAISDVLEHANQAMQSTANPDALLCLPPFYHKEFTLRAGQPNGVELFFEELLRELPTSAPPLFIYTFSLHTQQTVTPSVYGALCAKFGKRIAGIKANSTPNWHPQLPLNCKPNCTPIALQLHSNCTPVAPQSHPNRTPIAIQLHPNCNPITPQLHSDHTPIALQLHHKYTPITRRALSTLRRRRRTRLRAPGRPCWWGMATRMTRSSRPG